MKTDRELMQQALDFLTSDRWGTISYMDVGVYDNVEKLIESLRAALAEPVEPMALKWSPAPRKTEWGECMVCADVEIDRDHTLTLYCEGGQTAKVDAMLSPALRTALAGPVAETVAEEAITADRLSKMFQETDGIDKHQWGYQWRLGWNAALRKAIDYTAPPARRPLTDDEIWDIAANCLNSVAGRLQFARAIERAHKIGGNDD